MESKTPALLVVLVETSRLRWFVAAVGLDGRAAPLLRSDVGDLEKYRGLDLDGQVSFLRHRFCGVLQRGCDRLWARNLKACQFAFVFESPLAEPSGQLTAAIAEHFAQWLLNPPVAVLVSADGFDAPAPRLEMVAGALEAPLEELLRSRVGALLAARADEGQWELSRKKEAV